MARIDWVKQRLVRWAAWRDRRERGSQGYPKASAFTKMVVDTSGYRDATSMDSIDEVEAGITHLAVESLRASKGHLYRTLELIYVENVGVRRSAKAMCCAESTVKARLEQADHEIATWLRNRAQERDRNGEKKTA